MPRRILEGDVVSNKTDKTITVLVERRYMHPIYKKYLKKTSKFTAHDPNNAYSIGDRVQIIECRPISKTKRWTVLTDGAEAAPTPKAPKKAKEAAAKPKAEVKEKAPAKKAAPKKAAAKKKTTAKKKDA